MEKFCFIDFEFNGTANEYLTLVCCSLQCIGDDVENFWLHNSQESKQELAYRLQELQADGFIFVAYGVGAEARSFIALKEFNIDPMDFDWICLYVEWRTARFNNDKYEYGKYLHKEEKKGILLWSQIRHSVPPSFDPRENKGKDNKPTGVGYGDCVANILGIKIDSRRKNTMRDLIISAPDKFTEAEAMEIQEYCDSDLEHLPAILEELIANVTEVSGRSRGEVIDIMIGRGEYAAAVAHFETVGIPTNMEAIRNLSRNHWNAKNDLIEHLNDNYYPFYEYERKSLKKLKGEWVEKETAFERFIVNNDLYDDWPRNEPTPQMLFKGKEKGIASGDILGGLKRDESTLDDYKFVPALEALKQTKKSINNLKWFRPDSFDQFADCVGPDNRLRTFYGPFGTQTGRNAPPAKRYTFAMANWLRCTIAAPPGMAVTGIDYKSQEFLLGGLMSNDQNMIDAYRTGDPYCAFAIRAGAIPEGKTRHDYPEERDAYKICALAAMYGMGRDALFRRVKAAMSIEQIAMTTEAEIRAKSDKLYSDHKRIFRKYWDWTDGVLDLYKYQQYLMLQDGWMLSPNCDVPTSIKNWPVQSMGSCIMRRASVEAVKAGIKIISPLHDAIYMLHDIGDQASIDTLAKIMYDATEAFYEGADVGLDIDTHEHGHVWVEDRSRGYYEACKKYMQWQESDEDIHNRVMENVYGECV